MYFTIAQKRLCGKYTNYLPHNCGDYFVFSPHHINLMRQPDSSMVALPLAITVPGAEAVSEFTDKCSSDAQNLSQRKKWIRSTKPLIAFAPCNTFGILLCWW